MKIFTERSIQLFLNICSNDIYNIFVLIYFFHDTLCGMHCSLELDSILYYLCIYTVYCITRLIIVIFNMKSSTTRDLKCRISCNFTILEKIPLCLVSDLKSASSAVKASG